MVPHPRQMSAWALSLLLHTLLLVALCLLLPTQRRAEPPAGERSVGIVLSHQNAQQQIEYFEPQELAAETRQAPVEQLLPATADIPPLQIASLPIASVELPIESARSSLALPKLTATGQSRVVGQMDEAARAEQQALLRAAEALAPVTQVSVFGSPGFPGRSFVFVIDRSESMGGQGLGVLGAAAAELSVGLAHLEPRHQFQIIAYHHELVYFGRQRRLVAATPENKQAVADFLKGLAAFGGTQHQLAVQAALRLKPDVVFLLTDGGDPLLNDAQLRVLSQAAAGRTIICCIQFGFGPLREDDHFMQRLASRNGGAYLYVNMRQAAGT